MNQLLQLKMFNFKVPFFFFWFHPSALAVLFIHVLVFFVGWRCRRQAAVADAQPTLADYYMSREKRKYENWCKCESDGSPPSRPTHCFSLRIHSIFPFHRILCMAVTAAGRWMEIVKLMKLASEGKPNAQDKQILNYGIQIEQSVSVVFLIVFTPPEPSILCSIWGNIFFN